jgi:GNAT superfamily N-acetyltransferase
MHLHSYNTEVLTLDDVVWFVEVAAVRMLTDEVKRPELVNLDNLYKLAMMGVSGGTAFIVKKDGVPVGAIGAILTPNLYNPSLNTLSELFWYVLPEYRNTRAGYLLIKALDERAKEIAHDCTLSLLPSSNVAIKTLEKRGYSLCEFGFRKQIGE